MATDVRLGMVDGWWAVIAVELGPSPRECTLGTYVTQAQAEYMRGHLLANPEVLRELVERGFALVLPAS